LVATSPCSLRFESFPGANFSSIDGRERVLTLILYVNSKNILLMS